VLVCPIIFDTTSNEILFVRVTVVAKVYISKAITG